MATNQRWLQTPQLHPIFSKNKRTCPLIWKIFSFLYPRWSPLKKLLTPMWMNIQLWPTCPNSPKQNWSLVHLSGPNSTPKRLEPTGQVHRDTSEKKLTMCYHICLFWYTFSTVPSEGIEPVGNVVMKKAVFTVETISAGMGEVLVYVEDPAGHREEVC